jgi:hypothetical protein
MLTGAHVVIYSKDAEVDRKSFWRHSWIWFCGRETRLVDFWASGGGRAASFGRLGNTAPPATTPASLITFASKKLPPILCVAMSISFVPSQMNGSKVWSPGSGKAPMTWPRLFIPLMLVVKNGIPAPANEPRSVILPLCQRNGCTSGTPVILSGFPLVYETPAT